MLGYLLTLLITSSTCLHLHSTIPNPSLYHTTTQLDTLTSNLIPSPNPSLTISKRSCQSQNTTYQILQINPTQPTDSQGRKPLSAIVTCGIHARQLLASEVCVKFVEEVVKGRDWRLKGIGEGIGFRVFYVGNQMRDQVIGGQYCRRTDSNDVDINRNFPTGFQGQTPESQTNPGPYALSQPFSQCIQLQTTTKKPNIFLDIHTGQFSIYQTRTPTQSQKSYELEQSVLKSVVEKVCANCRLRDEGHQGVMFADVKIRKGVKWANLFEVYGGFQENLGELENCFVIFNPNTKGSYQYYVRRGKNMLVQYFSNILHQERPPSNQPNQPDPKYKNI